MIDDTIRKYIQEKAENTEDNDGIKLGVHRQIDLAYFNNTMRKDYLESERKQMKRELFDSLGQYLESGKDYKIRLIETDFLSNLGENEIDLFLLSNACERELYVLKYVLLCKPL